VDSTNRAPEVENERLPLSSGRLEEEQALASRDQTPSDADQTGSDSDQVSADCDQLAADRDQAASDQDLASGGDPDVHDASQGIRERTAEQRAQTSEGRMGAAARRDELAQARDLAALARDEVADARNLAVAQREGAGETENAGAVTGAEVVTLAAQQRRRAAQQRELAAEQRDVAAEDRRDAAQDRADAAEERLHALADREALLVELQREHKGRGEALRDQHLAEDLARTLQRSLSPPSLPRIAGLDVGVHHESSAPEDVGGDFYDLFALAPSRSAFFLGDVCGKGPAAAGVTSLARYTMRTAAMLHEKPEAVLMDLNTALLMEAGGVMLTCTVVYGEINMTAGAAMFTLAVAGHPPPLIVRADGSVETTPAHGTLLGAFQDPAFQTCQIILHHGDAIVICSDGILDTKMDGVRVDEQRVARLLSGTPRASAQALVNRLVHALGGIDRPLRDDIAVMALRRTPPE